MKPIVKYFLSFLFIIIFIAAADGLMLIFLGAPNDRDNILSKLESPEYIYQYESVLKPIAAEIQTENGISKYIISRENVIQKQEFLVPKPKDLYRIIVIGGSIAQILASNPSEMKDTFKKDFNKTDIEILNFATNGYDSSRIIYVFNEIKDYDPDLILLLTGNNDGIHAAEFNRIEILKYKTGIYLKCYSYIYRFLSGFIKSISDIEKGPTHAKQLWNKIFRKNLSDIMRIARKNKLNIALFTLPVNFSDYSIRQPLRLDNMKLFTAWHKFQSGNYQEAIIDFKKLSLYGSISDFYTAKSLEKLGNMSRAKKFYLKALEISDADNANRCPPSRNQIIREIASTYDNTLIDLEQIFLESAPGNLVGYNFFMDNCHWKFELNEVLVYPSIIDALIANNIIKPSIHKPEMEENTDMNDFNKRLKDIIDGKSPQTENDLYNSLISEAFNIDTTPDSPLSENILRLLKQVIRKKPYIISKERISILKDRFFTSADIQGWDIPEKQWEYLLLHISEAYRRSGNLDKALYYLNIIIERSPGIYSALLVRGLTLHALKKANASEEDFQKLPAESYYGKVLSNYRAVLEGK